MTATWPGVGARYLTVGGAHVEISGVEWTDTTVSATALCLGCSAKHVVRETQHPLSTEGPSLLDWAVANAQRWAQAHAADCRRVPQT